MDDGGENLFERLRPWLALGDVLGAVLQNLLARNNVLHVHISTPCGQLDRIEAID